MEQEAFLSGYCRMQDQSRMVAAEIENGILYADCSFGACPYEDRCTVASQLRCFCQQAEA